MSVSPTTPSTRREDLGRHREKLGRIRSAAVAMTWLVAVPVAARLFSEPASLHWIDWPLFAAVVLDLAVLVGLWCAELILSERPR